MRAFRGLAISILLGLAGWALLVLLVSHTAGAVTWVEDWSAGTANWTDPNGQPITCTASGGVLHAPRTCGQVFSVPRWSQLQPVVASTTLRGQPVGTTPYFCGLALLQDSNVYGQLAIGRDIAPVVTHHGDPGLVWWTNETGGPYYQLRGKPGVNDWQQMTVRWTPDGSGTGAGTWSANYNGIEAHAISKVLTAPLRIDLQGAPLYDDGSECQFGAVTVSGTGV